MSVARRRFEFVYELPLALVNIGRADWRALMTLRRRAQRAVGCECRRAGTPSGSGPSGPAGETLLGRPCTAIRRSRTQLPRVVRGRDRRFANQRSVAISTP